MAVDSALHIDDLKTDERADGFCELLGELTIKPALFERDIQRLRNSFYVEGRVDRRRAVEIFHGNRIMRARHDGWTEFYLEALTDFFLVHQGNALVLPYESETTLLAWLGDDPMIDNLGERRLMTRVFLRAAEVSERFERRLFDAVRDTLLHRPERWLTGDKRAAGVIDALDMQLIQRLVRSQGDPAEQRISRAAADFLQQLDRNAKRVMDQTGWRRLLASMQA